MLRDHCLHICKVLKHLREPGIQANVDKCKFYIQKTKFFGLIISKEDIQMDS